MHPTIESIDRYELADVGRIEPIPVMAKDPDGSYVRFEDMAAVVAKYKKDAERYRKLKSFALPKYVIRMKSGDSASLYREGDVIVDCGSWDVLDKALIEVGLVK